MTSIHTKTKCSLNKPPNEDGSCLNPDHIEVIQSKLDVPKGASVASIKKELNCTDDRCVVEKAALRLEEKSKILREALKPETASFDHNHWLNNTEIDTVMSQFRQHFPGFAHAFIHMIDLKHFEPANLHSFEYPVFGATQTEFGKEFNPNMPSALSTWKDSPLKSYGIICNTDSSEGSGQHWFALYISSDQRDPKDTSKPLYRIELFNSAGGGSGNKEFSAFWEEQAQKIAKATGARCEFVDGISDIQHQSPQTGNCGAYSLFYIYSRLMGEPPSEFDNPSRPISDKSMRKFREFCFQLRK